MELPPPLPQGGVLLHIGHPKSGSTALQTALVRERPHLRALGALYPGESRRNAEAGWVAMGMRQPMGRPSPPPETWDALRAEVADAGDLRVCVSNEDFARVPVSRVPAIVAGLGGDRVHVLMTVRRLDRALPSQWQERVKARERAAFEDWLRRMLDDPSAREPAHSPWLSELGSSIRRWTDVVGPDRFTVLVGDESDPELQPRTFEALLGLPAGTLWLESDRSNRGLTMNETELLRALNTQFVENRWSDQDYRRLIQSGFARALTRRSRSGEDAAIPPLPIWAREKVSELSEQRLTDIGELGVQVLGDLEQLRVPSVAPDPSAPSQPSGPPSSVRIEVAAAATGGLAQAAVRREASLVEQHERALRRARRRARRRAASRGLSDAPARALLAELCRRVTRRPRRSNSV